MAEGIRIGGSGKKSGAYVWKKYSKVTKSVTLSFAHTPPSTWTVSSNDIDVHSIDASFFVGFSGWYIEPQYTYEFVNTNQVLFDDTTYMTYTYNPVTAQIVFNGTVTSRACDIGDATQEKATHTFICFVVSDQETAYPDGGMKGGYWYELYGTPLNIVTWSGGTDEEIVAMVEAADRGIINLDDYWAVGDTRTVQLSTMEATGVGESQAAQQVGLVLMHAGGYELNEAVSSGRTTCSFVVGLKDCLATVGYMNSYRTNDGSWGGSARRTWCNSVFKNAIPSTLLPIFKQFKTITAKTYDSTTNQTSVDWFALPAAKEVFGGSASSAGVNSSFSNLKEFNTLFQFDYYKTVSNRVKKLGKTGSATSWWERSLSYSDTVGFCGVLTDGTAINRVADETLGLAPFGCI